MWICLLLVNNPFLSEAARQRQTCCVEEPMTEYSEKGQGRVKTFRGEAGVIRAVIWHQIPEGRKVLLCPKLQKIRFSTQHKLLFISATPNRHSIIGAWRTSDPLFTASRPVSGTKSRTLMRSWKLVALRRASRNWLNFQSGHLSKTLKSSTSLMVWHSRCSVWHLNLGHLA